MPAERSDEGDQAWFETLLNDLARSGSLRVDGDQVVNL